REMGRIPADPGSEALSRHSTSPQREPPTKPFARTFRVYDGVLVIGNVRLPACENKDMLQPLEMLAGRYKAAGEKGQPKPKPMKIGGAPRTAPPAAVEDPLLPRSEPILPPGGLTPGAPLPGAQLPGAPPVVVTGPGIL